MSTEFKAGDRVKIALGKNHTYAAVAGFAKDRFNQYDGKVVKIIRMERFPEETGVLCAYCNDFTFYPVKCLVPAPPEERFPQGTKVIYRGEPYRYHGVGLIIKDGPCGKGLVFHVDDAEVEKAAEGEWEPTEWRLKGTKGTDGLVFRSQDYPGKFFGAKEYHASLNQAMLAAEAKVSSKPTT